MSSKLPDLPEETLDSIAEQTGNYESILNLARSVPTLPSRSLAVEMLMPRRHFCFQRKQGIFHSRPDLSFSLWTSRTPVLPLLIAHQLRHTHTQGTKPLRFNNTASHRIPIGDA
jgi:hypothetical protein